MDVSGCGNELGGWRRGRVGGVWVEEGGWGVWVEEGWWGSGWRRDGRGVGGGGEEGVGVHHTTHLHFFT